MSGLIFEAQEIEKLLFSITQFEEKQLDPQSLHKKKVIVLAGPTACGKSAIGMMLAENIHGEIISADSMQIYKGMDIGTAKATLEERQKIPHYLIDIRDVTDTFNVVDFYYEARRACQVIHDRGGIPIVVGGSGFYIHALLYGPPVGPPSVPEVRQCLENEMEKFGSEAMYDRLVKLDPVYATSITPHDKQKIVRALEIIKLTGSPVSQLPWKSKNKPLDYDFHCWFLQRPRENLYKRIEKRCDKMLLDGLLEEVIELEKKGLRGNTTASQAIGYRQTLDYLETKQTRDDYRRYVEVFKQASRNYAKRQFTWFRRQECLFRHLDLDLHDPETVVDIIIQDFDSRL